jgi:hypothetical protein
MIGAHRIDQHVIGGEMLRNLDMFVPPSFQTRKRGFFAWRFRNHYQRRLCPRLVWD